MNMHSIFHQDRKGVKHLKLGGRKFREEEKKKKKKKEEEEKKKKKEEEEILVLGPS